jgi:hypothetical protein
MLPQMKQAKRIVFDEVKTNKDQTATAPRTAAQIHSDLDVMTEAVLRLQDVIYANPYFEKRYQDALERVVADLGDAGALLGKVLHDERETLIARLRDQVQ